MKHNPVLALALAGGMVLAPLTGWAGAELMGATPAVESINVYSPSLIIQGGTLVMFFGGWETPGQVNDKIYRAECHQDLGACDPPALMLDSVALGFQHLNDPSVIQMPGGYFIMYMTGVPAGGNGLIMTNNSTYYSVSSDAIHWTPPQLLVQNLWMPSATIGPDGDVLLYGNLTSGDAIIQYDLGQSGINIQSTTVVNEPKSYANVEVRYRPSVGGYQILAEVASNGTPNQIDYLFSQDGVNWDLQGDGIIHPQPGFGYVRTPAAHPLSENIVYYAQAPSASAPSNGIMASLWQSTPAVSNDVMAAAASNSTLWSPDLAIDGQAGSSYSSLPIGSSDNTPGVFLAAWLASGPQAINALSMTARMSNGQPLGFPASYSVFITAPDNSQWNYVGTYGVQPDSSGQVVIPLGGPFLTYGVEILPQQLGMDDVGNHIFQLSEVSLGMLTGQ